MVNHHRHSREGGNPGGIGKRSTGCQAVHSLDFRLRGNDELEETMVTMQKAQIGFQATLQVRNKLVQAYSDIMNMQV